MYFAFDGVHIVLYYRSLICAKVVNENKYETAAFLFVSYMLLTRIAFMWVTGKFFDDTRVLPLYIALNYAALAMLVLSVLFVIPNTIYTYRAWKSFGWKMYRNVGTDRILKGIKLMEKNNNVCLTTMNMCSELFANCFSDKFRIYQIFLSLLKVDLQFNCMLVVLGGFFIFASVKDAMLWINVCVVIVTIFWTMVAVQAVCHTYN